MDSESLRYFLYDIAFSLATSITWTYGRARHVWFRTVLGSRTSSHRLLAWLLFLTVSQSKAVPLTPYVTNADLELPLQMLLSSKIWGHRCTAPHQVYSLLGMRPRTSWMPGNLCQLSRFPKATQGFSNTHYTSTVGSVWKSLGHHNLSRWSKSSEGLSGRKLGSDIIGRSQP